MKTQGGDLPANLDKIHTTELGAQRIKKNLGLKDDDAVEFCVREITRADKIIRKGKNWYIFSDGIIITVNARSYTIITAHRKGA